MKRLGKSAAMDAVAILVFQSERKGRRKTQHDGWMKKEGNTSKGGDKIATVQYERIKEDPVGLSRYKCKAE